MDVKIIPKSGYERGKQDGAAVKGPFPPDFESYKRDLITRMKWQHQCGAFCFMPRGKTLDETIGRIEKMTLPECHQHAIWLHETRMANFPADLTSMPELKGWDQLEDDYRRGFMDSSGLRYEEYCWRRNQIAMDAFIYGFTNADAPVSSCCSEVLFLRTPQGPLFCRGYDAYVEADAQKTPKGDAPAKFSPVIIAYEGDEGYSRQGFINEKGIFAWGGGGGVYEHETFPEPQFYAPVGEFLYRYCATVAEAVSLYRRYAIFLGQPNQGVLANLFDSDAIGYDHSKRQVGFFDANEQGVVFNTWGGATAPELRALCDPENYLFQMYDKRMEFMWRLAREAGDELNEEVMWRAMLDHDSNWCNHHDSLPRGVSLWNVGCVLFKLATGEQESRMTYWDGTRFVHPCEVEPVHTTFPIRDPDRLPRCKPSEFPTAV